MAAKNKTVDAAGRIVEILEPLEPTDRSRVIHAALTLLGEDSSFDLNAHGASAGTEGKKRERQAKDLTEHAYFDAKEPRTKGEELAVAARYREEYQEAITSTRAGLEQIIRAARRNFDGGNFRRDLDNAKRKGLFNSGTGKDSIVLSHYGQKYVDALPDRDAVKVVRHPKRSGSVRRKRAAGRAKKK